MKPYYDHAGIQIFLGDCREILPTIHGAAVITDPPYGVGFRGAEWDAELVTGWFDLARAAAPLVVVITAPTTLWDYPRPEWVMCWLRPAAASRTAHGTFNHWTPVAVYGRGEWNPDTKTIHGMVSGYKNRGIDHPSPKPVELMQWLVGGVPASDLPIIDCFAGSGTTLVAAKNLNRPAIGIEIEEKYCEVAAQRLSQEVLAL
ncbi:DNA methylase N-4/N-6 [uncultured Caudovirales phage]|uniref:DNA methylase N-4/N-6 n=1 Tax=uncultured Caudovirales phage TaxID=2100421 RepID=A0A6J7XHN2_9CAUD|nr:DNA methylase N-4/N-6 [uncultured Caudovirales phage]